MSRQNTSTAQPPCWLVRRGWTDWNSETDTANCPFDLFTSTSYVATPQSTPQSSLQINQWTRCQKATEQQLSHKDTAATTITRHPVTDRLQTELRLTSHSTHYRSFQRWSSQPITWLVLVNKIKQQPNYNTNNQNDTYLQLLSYSHVKLNVMNLNTSLEAFYTNRPGDVFDLVSSSLGLPYNNTSNTVP